MTCGCGCGCGGERRDDSLGLVNELGRARTADRGGLHITELGEARDITEREEIIAGAQRTGRRRGMRGRKGAKRWYLGLWASGNCDWGQGIGEDLGQLGSEPRGTRPDETKETILSLENGLVERAWFCSFRTFYCL